MAGPSDPKSAKPNGGNAGVGPVVDPTKNVLDLVEAANKRQDDLRAAHDRLFEAEIGHLKEMASLRADHQQAMQAAEANRLNSIRQVDQANVNTAADRALAAIQTLAATTTSNAENLRTALTSTAATIAVQTQNTVAAINERIAALEKSSYEGKGKKAVEDPQMQRLSQMVENLTRHRASDTGVSQGISTSWGILLGAVALIASLLLIWSRATALTTPTQPQVIYVPAPPGALLPSTQPTQPVPR